ncbi:SH2B adapter protein 2-like isoform X2 [Antedon mediterranea]|uniref:SH2B adapter protein 2-like isoform X2 n=1 Tax=Antedon mediterranea TaxID=105859 RepID=UPI003AF885D1
MDMANGHLSDPGGSTTVNNMDSNDFVSPWPQWPAFCETEAHKSAVIFANCFGEYVMDQPELRTKDKAKQYANRYIKHFLEHFEHEINKTLGNVIIENHQPSPHFNRNEIPRSRQGSFQSLSPSLPPPDSSSLLNHPNGNGNVINSAIQSSHSQDDLSSGARIKKSASRKMSFRKFGHNIRNRFRKQSSGDVDTSRFHRTKDSDIVVREGIVNNLTGEDQQGRSQWEKSRLLLVSRPEGLTLEFYAPPKSSKPKAGIYCFLIEEVRETTELELPGTKHAFALKAENNLEFVMEAQSIEDMQAWLASIQESMKVAHRGASLDRRRPLPSVPVDENHHMDSQLMRNSLAVEIPTDGSSPDRSPNTSPPPQIPPREPCPQRASSSASSEQAITPITAPEGMVLVSPENDHVLASYPWFHGTLSRIDAAQLVLQGGHTCHGVFLVRQSETRRGECVLTFNFHGRPKHLRLQLDPDGKCKVTHIWFDSIFDMLDHFRTHPIPLDSRDGSSQPDVSLTVYVPNTIRPRTPSSAESSDGNVSFNPDGMPMSEFTAPGNSFFLPINDPMARPPANGINTDAADDNHRGGRAVRNQYAFV